MVEVLILYFKCIQTNLQWLECCISCIWVWIWKIFRMKGESRMMPCAWIESDGYVFCSLRTWFGSEPVEVRWRARKDERLWRNGARCGHLWYPFRRTPDIISLHFTDKTITQKSTRVVVIWTDLYMNTAERTELLSPDKDERTLLFELYYLFLWKSSICLYFSCFIHC